VEREPERDDGDAHQAEVDEESRPDPAHRMREGPDGVGAASHAARDSGEAGRHHEVQRRGDELWRDAGGDSLRADAREPDADVEAEEHRAQSRLAEIADRDPRGEPE
jgi:hypothetical protein